MNLIGAALAGIYVVVATRSASAALQESGGSAGTGGGDITCAAGETMNSAVLQPDTTLKVTCPDTSAAERVSEAHGYDIYLDADCSQSGELSSVCPGATVSAEQQGGEATDTVDRKTTKKQTVVTLQFPQLPDSQQVVCVRCPAETKSGSGKDCKALITVTAASPQGPQACAVGGASITLEINKAGGSAQFKCGNDRTLEPTEPTKAYADDCKKVETLKDMTRSDARSKSGYVTVKVDKIKKKRLCYLCQPSASEAHQRGGENDPCKVYVQVGGSAKCSAGVAYGLALPCLAAMLRFI